MSARDPHHDILAAYGPEGDPDEARVVADYFLERGDLPMAASALDRAFGLQPGDGFVAEQRRDLLDSLARVEHGIRFRYVPAGSFLMGSETGDPDERPTHGRQLDGFWISETPISWSAYCDLMGWEPPPLAFPRQPVSREEGSFYLHEENKIRHYYCDTEPGWGQRGTPVQGIGNDERTEEQERARPARFDRVPMVAVGPHHADDLATRLSNGQILYRLPTEAEWEKAARGGLIAAPYSWGHEPPSRERCDFDHFGDFHIAPPKRFPPNGYGLYGMCGGVWEWTSDRYDALAYGEYNQAQKTAAITIGHPEPDDESERAWVLRGGSWADCAEVVTVSYRMSRSAASWQRPRWGEHVCPNVGFRLCRVELGAGG